ncbi:MAG: CHC2 zinc finger domain-containing protein [Bacteroidota bacterium]|nr:CHC2 zinc finger domain-containing protein [Bacteroidota bacterium]
MNCEQANQIDLVDYLCALGFNPKKISREDHWYLSPFRQEKEASFKVNKNKNVWYDHGLGKGGSLVDFAKVYHRCNVSEALQKISLFHPQITLVNIAERKCTSLAQKRSLKFEDESKLYEGCKDLNEWNVKHKEHSINQKMKGGKPPDEETPVKY